jgi:hypothetical protein
MPSVHDEWLRGLRSNESLLVGDSEELDRFAEEIRAWSRPVRLTVSAPFRLCFRLDEPADHSQETAATDTLSADWVSARSEKSDSDSKDLWNVHFFLQGQEDRSLLLPVREVWCPKRKNTPLLERRRLQRPRVSPVGFGAAASV